MKIYIGTYMPNGSASGVYIQSLIGLTRALDDAGHEVFYDFVEFEKSSIRAKNLVVEMFLSTKCDYLLYIEQNVAFNQNDVLKMIDADKDVIGALVPEEEINWEYVKTVIDGQLDNIDEHSGKFFVDFDESVKEFSLNTPLKVSSLKVGLTLFKRQPLESLKEKLSDYSYSSTIKVSQFFEPIIGEKGEYIEEDISLSLKLKSQGVEIYVAPWVATGKYGHYFYRGNFAASVLAEQEDRASIPTASTESQSKL
jgi:hypothetical protein